MERSALVAPLTAGAIGIAVLATGSGPPCPLHATTGWWCPLCGGTRATRALLSGRLATSLHDNALAVPIIVAIAWALAAWAWPRLRIRLPAAALWSAIGFLALFAVLRNLPGLTALAPNT